MKVRRCSSGVRQVELTDAALSLIAERGIAALSTRSLAAEVGLSSGALFKHFASIEALLLAVVARVEAVITSTYPPRTLPPAERLERFIEARSAAVGNQIGILRLVQSEQFLLALPKGASERLAACVRQTRAFTLECVREAQASGEFRTDLPAEALAPIVMGTVQFLALARPGTKFRTVEMRSVRSTLLALMRAPASASRKRRVR